MVRPGGNNPAHLSVFGIVACITIDNKKSWLHVEVVDSSPLVSLIASLVNGDVDFAPPDSVSSLRVVNNPLILGASTCLDS